MMVWWLFTAFLACSHEAPPEVAVEGGPPRGSVPVVSVGTASGLPPVRVLEPLVACTKKACPAEEPCCNACRVLSYSVEGLPARAAPGVELPVCAPDGCGRCATGYEVRGGVDTSGAYFRVDVVAPQTGVDPK